MALIQGAYFVATGVWSRVDIDSFQRVTGPKTDLWLVNTVGVLVTAIGLGLILAGTMETISAEVVLIADCST